MKKYIAIGFIFLCIVKPVHIYSQAIYQVTIDEKILHATDIIEGKVLAQKSFWNASHTMIFTANEVEVYKCFKGAVSSGTIEVMTTGGTVGMQSIDASDLLTLDKGNIGVFFCYPNAINIVSPFTGNKLFDVYSSGQGCFTYDLNTKTASAPFVRYASIENQLYKELVQLMGHQPVIVNPSFDISLQARPQTSLAPTISSFSPRIVNAGALLDPTNNVLTINGAGFGNAPSGTSAVLFDDANNGSGGTPFEVLSNSPLIQSWTDNQIKIRVPSRAGTGSFEVRDDLNVSNTSPNILTVNYSVLTQSFSGGTIIKEFNLMNDNGSGGYTVLFSTGTAGGGLDLSTAPEKETFLRALNTWKEVAGFNVIEGGGSSTQRIAADGENLIVFDNSNTGTTPLAAGVLAVCYSYSNILCSAANEMQKSEFDIVIRNTGVSTGSTSFTSGPCPPTTRFAQSDLETVLLHELGHALDLAHINDPSEGSTLPNVNPGKLMHFSILNGVSRKSPDYSAYRGALYSINPQSNSYGTCALPAIEMTPLSTTIASFDECPVSFPATATLANTTINFDLVHTTSNKYADPLFTGVNCDGTGTAITNNAYYAIKTDNSGSDISIAVTGYATSPASVQSACTGSGIRLSLYQVNSCPTGQSFPAPVACRTFGGNEVLPAINGLQPNANYLIYLDGISNTKAFFTLTINSTVLPVTLVDFKGNIVNNKVSLYWKTINEVNSKAFIIEKSFDGAFFTQFAIIAAKGTSYIENNYGTTDDKPYSGFTFYRLKIVDEDGRFKYSGIVKIKTPKVALVVGNIYPNPTSGKVSLQVLSDSRKTLTVEAYDLLGKSVINFKIIVETGFNEKAVFFNSLASGTYFILVKDVSGNVIEKSKLIKN